MTPAVTVGKLASEGYGEESVVSLEAKIDPAPGTDPVWSWEFQKTGSSSFIKHPNDEGANTLEFKMTKDLEGQYKAIATVGGTAIPSEPAEVKFKVKKSASSTTGELAEEPAVWHLRFAVGAAIVLLVLGGLFIWQSAVLEPALGMPANVIGKMTTRESLAARMFGILLLLGAVVLIVGVWMVSVEWRGRFQVLKKEGTPKSVAFPAKEVLETLAKLKGAGLVLLVGLTIILAAAWIGSSAVADPNPSPSATPTP